MLWFKFIFGANQFVFYFLLSCSHYHNVEQWQIKTETSSKKVKPRIKFNNHLNQNICTCAITGTFGINLPLKSVISKNS